MESHVLAKSSLSGHWLQQFGGVFTCLTFVTRPSGNQLSLCAHTDSSGSLRRVLRPPTPMPPRPSFWAQGRPCVRRKGHCTDPSPSGSFQRGLFLYMCVFPGISAASGFFYKAFSTFGFCDTILSFLYYFLPVNSSLTCYILYSHSHY